MNTARHATRLLAAIALFGCLSANAFTVEVVEIIGGRDVSITPSELGQQAIVRVVNREDRPLRCELRFDSGPDERLRRIELDPYAGRTVTVKIVRSSTQRVRVRALCE